MSITRSLDALPNELVLIVLSTGVLTARDFYALILTSRRTAILAKPFLYKTFSCTSLDYSSFTEGNKSPCFRFSSSIGPFLANLARQPEHRPLVKRIELQSLDLHAMKNSILKPREWESLDQLTQNHGYGTILGEDTLPAGWHLVALLLMLCSDVEELVIDDSTDSLNAKNLWQIVGHQFPRLRYVRIEAVGYGLEPDAVRWQFDFETDFELHAFWMNAPALQRFEVRGAGHSSNPFETYGDLHGDMDIGIVEPGSLSIRELVFDECLMPMHSMGVVAGSCNALLKVSVSWAYTVHYALLRFADLATGLARHKNSLELLLLDVSRVKYHDFPVERPWTDETITIETMLAAPPPGLLFKGAVHSYDGLGSLGDFLTLRHLEISVCVLGPFDTVEDLVGMLPEHLESLVLLSPTQYGQPSIQELIDGLLCLGLSRMRNLRSVNQFVVER